MNPGFLTDRPALEATNIVESTSLAVLGAFVDEGLITTTELEYGYEDLPLLATLCGLLRDEALAWHRRRESKPDFRIFQIGFVNAFRAGLEVANQLHHRLGESIRLESDLSGIYAGSRSIAVGEPLASLIPELATPCENAFVGFQDRCLAIAASSKNETLLGDFFGCGCLWAALAGVEAGLGRLQPVAA